MLIVREQVTVDVCMLNAQNERGEKKGTNNSIRENKKPETKTDIPVRSRNGQCLQSNDTAMRTPTTSTTTTKKNVKERTADSMRWKPQRCFLSLFFLCSSPFSLALYAICVTWGKVRVLCAYIKRRRRRRRRRRRKEEDDNDDTREMCHTVQAR